MIADTNPTRTRSLKRFISLGLAALTILLYARSLNLPFLHYDDDVYVYENAHVLGGLTADNVRWAFTTFDAANWHPLTWLSLQLDATLYGDHARAFHATNILLHAANAVFLFLVLGRMTRTLWRSALVAALFALHPMHVESVAWVAERKDVLSTLFWLLTIGAYAAYVQRPGVLGYLRVGLALALGLLAKPMVVTLPFVLLLLDVWPLGRWSGAKSSVLPEPRRSLPALIVEKAPFLVLVVGSCVMTFLAQRQGEAVRTAEQFPLGERLGNAALAYVGYVGKTLWPYPLAVHYPHAHTSLTGFLPLAAALALVVITVLVLIAGRRWPYLGVGWLWYLGTLVPVIGLVQVGDQGMADRYSYLPSIGLFMLAVWGIADLVRAWSLPRPLVGTVTVGTLACCGVLTWIQQGYWSDNLTLWEHAASTVEGNALAHHYLGLELSFAGRREEALAQFSQAVLERPQFFMAHYHVGVLLCELGRWGEAPAEYEAVIALAPGFARAHCDLGNVYWHLGRHDEALHECRRATEIDPSLTPAYRNLGAVLLDLGRAEEARDAYVQALQWEPSSAESHYNLGNVLRELIQPEQAVAEYRKALEQDPKHALAHGALASALLDEGRYDEAEASTRTALELLAPSHPLRQVLHNQLARCRSLRSLEPKLPGILHGEAPPQSAVEQAELASLCLRPDQRHFLTAVTLFRTAFAAEPALSDDLGQQWRYRAAEAAVQAGTSKTDGPGSIPDEESSKLRKQALDWLRADLAAWTRPVRAPGAPGRIKAQHALRGWQRDPLLAAVRDESKLRRLPAEEQREWRQLWADVSTLLAQASASHPAAASGLR